MLHELSQQGYFLAVATGKSRVGLNRALNAAKLLSTFHAIKSFDAVRVPSRYSRIMRDQTRSRACNSWNDAAIWSPSK